MTSGMPERTTILAASIFDFMPPTAVSLFVPRAIFSSAASIFSMTEMVLGLALPKFSMTPSTVVRMTSKSAGNSDATSADNLSLSPNLISVNETASFSLMIGHDAAAEQRDERVAGVEMAFVMFEVVVREQHLRDVQTVPREQFRVHGHEPRLADGGAGLQFGEFGRAFFQAERAHARADRAAR